MNALDALAAACAVMFTSGVFLALGKAQTDGSSRQRRPLPWRRMASAAGLGGTVGVVAFVLTGIIGLAVVVGALGAGILPWWQARKRRRSSRETDSGFADFVEGIVTHVRAGGTALGALAQVSEQLPASIREPAALFARNYRASGNAEIALAALKLEWSSASGDLVVETLRVVHEVGGLATVDVLLDLADQLRRYRNMRLEIEAKQSWVRVAARVGVAAPWVVLAFLSLRPEAVQAYNSPAGIALLVIGSALSVCAYLAMLALGKMDARRRVFAL